MKLKFRWIYFSIIGGMIFTHHQLLAQMHPNFANKLSDFKTSKSISLFVKGDVHKTKILTEKLGGNFKFSAGDISSITLPSYQYQTFLLSDFYERVEQPYHKGAIMEDQANINNSVVAVHNGTAPLPSGYDGTNVIIGFLDSGLDFNHPDFKRPNGNTRIKYLWDQANTSATAHPQPFNYGADWDSIAINQALCTHIPPTSFFGHGTLTAGVACGNSQQKSNYRAIAPNADLIFVAIDFNGVNNSSFASSVADGAAYCFAKASALGKPCVINASLGEYNGSHDATDLATQAIENLVTAQNGRMFVASLGNSGGKKMHLGYQVPADSAYTYFDKYSIGGGKYVAYIELYSDFADCNNVQFAIGADVTSPNFNHRNRTKWMNVLTDYNMASVNSFTKYDTIKNNAGQRLGVLESYCEKQSGHYAMYFGVYIDSVTNYTWRFMTKGSGKFDVWSHPNYTKTSLLISSGLPSVSQLPDITHYMLPDTEKTMVSSWACSSKLISVANYLNRNVYTTWQGNNFQCSNSTVGNIYPTSSKGPTRTGLQKPDITASGEWTMAANDIYWLNWAKTNNPSSLLADTLHGPHKGTSAAAPVVSGIIALYLQKTPNANWQEIKAALTTCAKTDNFTGNSLPNAIWGYGKVDAYRMLNCVGCTKSNSVNYNPLAKIDDSSCVFNGAIAYFKPPSKIICTSDSIQFIDSSLKNPNQWIWQFDNGTIPLSSISQHPTVVYITPGKHYITLNAGNNSGNSSYTDSVIVQLLPTSAFGYINEICEGYNNQFIYTGNATDSANFIWTFIGGTPSSNTIGPGPVMALWNSPGTKTTTLLVSENGCTSKTTQHTFNVKSNPTANFSYHQQDNSISFINQSLGANSFNWSFGDAGSSTTQNPVHIYKSTGKYVVTLIAMNGNCADDDSMVITISKITNVDEVENHRALFLVNYNQEKQSIDVKWKNNQLGEKKVELFNMLSQLVYSTPLISDERISIAAESLPKGIYLVKCTYKNGISETLKVIKE